MKRDMELIFKILEYYENRTEISIDKNPAIEGYDNNVIAYHLRRMYEAGLLDAETLTSSTTRERIITVHPFGITWQGHEFLDFIHNKDIRDKLNKKLGNTFNNIPFQIIQELALSIGRQHIVFNDNSGQVNISQDDSKIDVVQNNKSV